MKKILLGLSAALLAGGTIALAASSAGTSADPLVSRSYMEQTYAASIEAQARSIAAGTLSQAQTQIEQKLSDVKGQYTDAALEDMLVEQVAGSLGGTQSKEVTLSSGGVISGRLGVQFCLISGAATVSSGTLIDITTGKEAGAGTALTLGRLYLSAEDGAVVRATKASTLRMTGRYTVIDSGSYRAKYTRYADALNTMGLFSGTDLGYELERVPTRAEGLVMLLRMLGKEQAVQQSNGKHPFNDVPDWASKYVAYAYQNGYTSGVSKTQFGTQNDLTLNDYMTFLLRALGYRDADGDFSWAEASNMAVRCGILTSSERQALINRGIFFRDDVVYTSYQTLFCSMKNSSSKLYESLLAQGVFTESQLDQALLIFL